MCTVHVQKQSEGLDNENSTTHFDEEARISMQDEQTQPCTPERKTRTIADGANETHARGGKLEEGSGSECRDEHIQNVYVPDADEESDSEWDTFIVQQE